jgi:hypothetical protein
MCTGIGARLSGLSEDSIIVRWGPRTPQGITDC